jgi:hypothetical protein
MNRWLSFSNATTAPPAAFEISPASDRVTIMSVSIRIVTPAGWRSGAMVLSR